MKKSTSAKIKLSIILIIAVVSLGEMGQFNHVFSEPYLKLTGEKGFSLDYHNEITTGDPKENLLLNQYLFLDLQGELGPGYGLKGHLTDLPYAKGQLFLEIAGPKAGLTFGEGNLRSFSTSLTPWQGNYNGLTGYLTNDKHSLKIAYANPTGVSYTEEYTLRDNLNYFYLNKTPVVTGSVIIKKDNEVLLEGIHYQIDYSSGRIDLLFFPETALALKVDYVATLSLKSETSFLAIQEESRWNKFAKTGLFFFTPHHSPESEAPFLLGHHLETPFYNYQGLYTAWQTEKWQWELEVGQSQAVKGSSSNWDYIDNMQGNVIAFEAFSNATHPANWLIASTYNSSLQLTSITPQEDLKYTKDGKKSLALQFHLDQGDEQVSITHHFANNLDLTNLAELHFWMFEAGKKLELEVQIITSENNYYQQVFASEGYGWRLVKIELAEKALSAVGFPDLKLIQSLRILVRNKTPNLLEGKLVFSQIKFLSRSMALNRWNNITTSDNSLLSLSTTTSINPLHQSASDTDVLQWEYSLQPRGYGMATYYPRLAIDASSYHTLEVYLKMPSNEPPEKLQIILGRGEEEYRLQLSNLLYDNNWHQYRLLLDNIPSRFLEKIDKISLQVINESDLFLKSNFLVHALILGDYQGKEARVIKSKSQYQNKEWTNRTTFLHQETGLKSPGNINAHEAFNLQNLTEYTGEVWQLKSEIATYRRQDRTQGIWYNGKQGAVEATFRNQKRLRFSYEDTAADAQRWQASGEYLGKNYSLSYQNNYLINNSLLQTTISRGLLVNYQKQRFAFANQLWHEKLFTRGEDQTNLKNNFLLAYTPNSHNYVRLQSGFCRTEERIAANPPSLEKSFLLYLEGKCTPKNWLQISGSAKSLINPKSAMNSAAPKEILTIKANEDNYFWEASIRPNSKFAVTVNQRRYTWEVDFDDWFRQKTHFYQFFYQITPQSKVTLFYKNDDTQRKNLLLEGLKYGFNGKLRLYKSGETEIYGEFNSSKGNQIANSPNQELLWKLGLKNLFYPTRQTKIHWGFRVEASRNSGNLKRYFWQQGFEKGSINNNYSYGVKSEYGLAEDKQKGDQPILDNTLFYTYKQQAHQVAVDCSLQKDRELSLKLCGRYTYQANTFARASLQGEYQKNQWANRLGLKAELVFYWR